MAAYIVEGGLAFHEVNMLCRVNGDDDEWIRMTGYYDQRIATTVHDGKWATMDVFRALDAGKAVYGYMRRGKTANVSFPIWSRIKWISPI